MVERFASPSCEQIQFFQPGSEMFAMPGLILYTAGQVFLDDNVNVRTFAIPCPVFLAGRTHEQCFLTSNNLSIYAVHTSK